VNVDGNRMAFLKPATVLGVLANWRKPRSRSTPETDASRNQPGHDARNVAAGERFVNRAIQAGRRLIVEDETEPDLQAPASNKRDIIGPV